MCSPIPDVVQEVLSGSVKAYAIGSAERSAALLNVPTSREAGLPEFRAFGWYGLFAPRNVPGAELSKLSDAPDQALDDANVRRRFGPRRDSRVAKFFDDDLADELFQPED
jgi:tripartite-type tricarboxylate transporter receptor subunit TctC